MRFIVTMMHQTSVQARVSVQMREGEVPEEPARRVRDTFLDNAREVRASRAVQVMTEDTLQQFSDLAYRISCEQASSGAGRYVTAYTQGGEEVFHAEGQIALLYSASDITCIIEAIST
ncbi:hypothetical protein [Sphingomonas sp. 3-13AW]|uniref:hypothetical protein n=1 Tax=Sphingomonas sp. 3-13AW TaxID=3050450 RepID=UPI003BB65B0C